MNKKKGITTIIVALAMFCMVSMSALAVSNVIVTLPKNQVWTASKTLQRFSTDYSYVLASCDSVYPTDSSSDNFSKIQVRIVDASGKLIMDKEYEVLEERKLVEALYIKEGHLSENPVYIQFRGNTNAAAEAVVNYFGF